MNERDKAYIERINYELSFIANTTKNICKVEQIWQAIDEDIPDLMDFFKQF